LESISCEISTEKRIRSKLTKNTEQVITFQYFACKLFVFNILLGITQSSTANYFASNTLRKSMKKSRIGCEGTKSQPTQYLANHETSTLTASPPKASMGEQTAN
jgi:hypothetical protein